MTLLALSFTAHFAINLAIFCIVTLIFAAIDFRVISANDEYTGIIEIMACISWLTAVILFTCVTESSLAESRSALICGAIAGAFTNFLFIAHTIAAASKGLPEKIKASKEKRKAKKLKVEIKVKSNILDL